MQKCISRVMYCYHWFFCGVCVVYLFSFLCCPIYVSWCSKFRIENEVRFAFTSNCLQKGSFLIYIICVCLLMVVSITYCVVFLFCFSSFCVCYAASFSGLSIFFIAPSVFSNAYHIFHYWEFEMCWVIGYFKENNIFIRFKALFRVSC